MGTGEPQVGAGGEAEQASGGQIIVKMLKQEDIIHILVGSICREMRKFRPDHLQRQYPLEEHLFN